MQKKFFLIFTTQYSTFIYALSNFVFQNLNFDETA